MTNRHYLTIMDDERRKSKEIQGREIPLRKNKGGKIREWLIDLRVEQGLTQGAVADAVGIAQPSYYEFEKGISTPKPETAKKIGAVLGFSWTRFYEAENTKSDNVDGNGQGQTTKGERET